jgi:hypothetical protein
MVIVCSTYGFAPPYERLATTSIDWSFRPSIADSTTLLASKLDKDHFSFDSGEISGFGTSMLSGTSLVAFCINLNLPTVDIFFGVAFFISLSGNHSLIASSDSISHYAIFGLSALFHAHHATIHPGL